MVILRCLIKLNSRQPSVLHMWGPDEQMYQRMLLAPREVAREYSRLVKGGWRLPRQIIGSTLLLFYHLDSIDHRRSSTEAPMPVTEPDQEA
jgi:hypothetical protein